jgi:membrane protein implicated in regulation of membrane protease activity
MEAWIYWLIIILALSFVEIITINLVTIWFVASAAIALLVSLFIDSFYIQFIVFGVCGLAIMVLTRPLLKKLLTKDKTKTNLDRVIGMSGICTEEISKNRIGEVKVDGKRWSAISQSKINEGDEVIVTDIDGVKLKVKKGE